MNEGYFYFKPADSEKNEIDKSLGYICISRQSVRNGYSIQCSLNRDRIIKSSNARRPIEVFISPAIFITNGALQIGSCLPVGKFSFSQKGRLFLDSFMPSSVLDSFIYAGSADNNLYVIITAGERTIYYSEIYLSKTISSADTAKTSEPQKTQYQEQSEPKENIKVTEQNKNLPAGREFDPFNTMNASYKWSIYEIRPNGDFYIDNMSSLELLLHSLNIHYEMFAKTDLSAYSVFPDTFLKTSYSALQIAGHILTGEYTDPQSGRRFNVIGLPGLNFQNPPEIRKGKKRYISRTNNSSRSVASSIKMFARWHAALKKVPGQYSRNYNGYWLYYFDAKSGLPVKAVIKNS